MLLIVLTWRQRATLNCMKPMEANVDTIFTEEVVSELHTLQDMLRWTVSRFNAAGLFYGHGTDNAWDEAVQLVLPTLYLPVDVPSETRFFSPNHQ